MFSLDLDGWSFWSMLESLCADWDTVIWGN